MIEVDENGRRPRGFQRLTAEQRSEIARRGGKAVHEQGVAPKWTAEEAREAGRKGGTVVSQDREYMRELGKKSAESRRLAKQAREAAEAAPADE